MAKQKRELFLGQRVGVLVDVQNLYYSAKHLYKKKVNYGNILKEAVRGRSLIRAIAYVVKSEKDNTEESLALPGTEKSFFDALKTIGFEVKSKDLQVYSGGFKKGDWDVGIAMDAIELAPRLDVVVLVSGDGDYIPLVEHLRRAVGCKVESMSFGRSTSSRLKESVDEFSDLDKDPRKYLISGRSENEE